MTNRHGDQGAQKDQGQDRQTVVQRDRSRRAGMRGVLRMEKPGDIDPKDGGQWRIY